MRMLRTPGPAPTGTSSSLRPLRPLGDRGAVLGARPAAAAGSACYSASCASERDAGRTASTSGRLALCSQREIGRAPRSTAPASRTNCATHTNCSRARTMLAAAGPGGLHSLRTGMHAVGGGFMRSHADPLRPSSGPDAASKQCQALHGRHEGQTDGPGGLVAVLPASGAHTTSAAPNGTVAGGGYVQMLHGDPMSVTVLIGENGSHGSADDAAAEKASKQQRQQTAPLSAADLSPQSAAGPRQQPGQDSSSSTETSSSPVAPAPFQPAGWRVRPWVSEPKHISAILARTHNLGRFERIIEQHSMFLNSRHIAVALSILPGVADGSRKQLSSSGSSSSADAFPDDQSQQQSRLQSAVPPHAQGLGVHSTPRDGVQPIYTSMEEELAARARRVRVLTLAGRLAQSFLRFLPQYNSADLATAVWALARLRYQPSQRWATSVLQASYRCMERFEPGQLSRLLWGLAVLRIEPGPAWLAAAQRCSLQAAREGSMSPQGLANSLWALASISSAARPALRVEDKDEELLQEEQRRLARQQHGQEGEEELGSDEVDSSFHHDGDLDEDEDDDPAAYPSRIGTSSSRASRTAAAAASAAAASAAASAQLASANRHSGGHQRIGRQWVEAFLDALTPQLPSFEPQHLAMTLTALAKLRHQPQASFMQNILPRLWDSLELVGPGGVANVLWSLAHLNYRPHRHWLGLCLAEAEAQLPQMTGKEKSMTIWALALLQAEPRESWLRKFEAESHSQLSTLQPRGLSTTVWAMARLGFRPGIMWMDKAAQVSQDQISSFGPQGLSNLAWALAALKYTPHPAWLKTFVAMSTRSLSDSSPQSLSNTALALAKLAPATATHPGPAWTGAFLAASAKLLRRQKAAAQDAEARAVELARQRAGGASSAASRAVAAAAAAPEAADAAAACGFSAQELANVLWALSKMKASPSPQWLAHAEAVALALVPRMTAQNVGNTLCAVARMPQLPGEEELVDGAVTRMVWLLQHEAHHVCSQDVANSLYALAKLGFEPGPHNLPVLLAAAERLLPSSSHEELAQVLWAICKLGASPSPSLLPKVVQASWPMLGRMSYCTLWTLLSCLAALGYSPPPEWIKDAAAATASAACQPQARRLPLRIRTKMNDGVLYALEELGYLSPGDEGQHQWQEKLFEGHLDYTEEQLI